MKPTTKPSVKPTVKSSIKSVEVPNTVKCSASILQAAHPTIQNTQDNEVTSEVGKATIDSSTGTKVHSSCIRLDSSVEEGNPGHSSSTAEANTLDTRRLESSAEHDQSNDSDPFVLPCVVISNKYDIASSIVEEENTNELHPYGLPHLESLKSCVEFQKQALPKHTSIHTTIFEKKGVLSNGINYTSKVLTTTKYVESSPTRQSPFRAHRDASKCGDGDRLATIEKVESFSFENLRNTFFKIIFELDESDEIRITRGSKGPVKMFTLPGNSGMVVPRVSYESNHHLVANRRCRTVQVEARPLEIITCTVSRKIESYEDDVQESLDVESEGDDNAKVAKKRKRRRKNRSHSSKQGNKNTAFSPYEYLKMLRYEALNVLRAQIVSKIETDINTLCRNSSNADRYQPVPLLIVSHKIVRQYFKYSNVVIFSNPQFEKDCDDQIFYDDNPSFIGENVQFALSKIKSMKDGIKVHLIKHKTLAILTPRYEFMNLISQHKGREFLEVKVPDVHLHEDDEPNKEYILIACCSNTHDSDIQKESLWTPNFAAAVYKSLSKNLVGTPANHKHHGCIGKYHGFGLISKYSLNDNLSINEFAGNSVYNPRVSSILDILKKDVAYMINRHQNVLPLGVYAGFLLITSMVEFASTHPDKCADVLELVRISEINNLHICLSNWVCHNAETLKFHQEFDSTYTFLGVPFWDREQFVGKRGKDVQGTANFLFKWSSKDSNKNCILPIEMSDGTTILFSGFGCYHRQQRTNEGTFWNYGTYHNKSFYQKFRCSLARCLAKDLD